MTFLDLKKSNISTLQELPRNLRQLDCSSSNLTSLDGLPQTIIQLNCADNKLTTIDQLHDGLKYFFCAKNQLVSISRLPESICYFSCCHNQLIFLPKLPDKCDVNGVDNPWIWSARVRDAPKVGLSMNKVAKIQIILCKYYARQAFKKLFGRYIDNWLDKPVTSDGRLGIRVRIGLREVCGHQSLYPPQ